MARLAHRQHGVVGRRQLLAAGIAVDLIERRLRSGHLIPIHRGVYAVGHKRLRIEGIWMAVVLAGGPGAVLSHRDAAALWDLRRSSRSAVDITVPTRAGRGKRKGITVHRSTSLADAVHTRRGIPVTTVSRTLLDLADVVSPQALEKAFAQAEILRLYDHGALEAELRANPGRRGAPAFSASLSRRAPRHRTRSGLEDAFLALCTAYGIPLPRTNVWLDPYEADCLWPEQRVIVELDSAAFHDTLTAFHGDRAKANALTAAGYRVFRFIDRQIDGEPDAVAAVLSEALGLTPRRPRRRGPRRRRTVPPRRPRP